MPRMASALGLIFCLFTVFHLYFLFLKHHLIFCRSCKICIVKNLFIYFWYRRVWLLEKLAVKGKTAVMQFVKGRILWLCK